MNEQAVLYALSTLAQTCAALAALVGALGLYRAQSARTEQAQADANLRHTLVTSGGLDRAAGEHFPIANIVSRSREVLADNPDNYALGTALAQLSRYDPSVRRSSRLIVIVGAWDTGAAFLSLIGFTVVPYLTSRWWTPAILSLLAVGTAVTTVAMLFEANGSLVKWLHKMKLQRLVVRLERKPRP